VVRIESPRPAFSIAAEKQRLNPSPGNQEFWNSHAARGDFMFVPVNNGSLPQTSLRASRRRGSLPRRGKAHVQRKIPLKRRLRGAVSGVDAVSSRRRGTKLDPHKRRMRLWNVLHNNFQHRLQVSLDDGAAASDGLEPARG
jgi:hypothetical protein